MHNQHHLLAARARTISLPEIAGWDDETVRATFQKLRWPETEGDPVCPKCGSMGHYYLKTREQWRCKGCHHTFSITSGTWLASTKLPLRTILIAMVTLANAVKGMSALQLMRQLGVQYKTAYVLYLKLRDALWQTRDQFPAMTGQVEMDGAYLNPSKRYPNKVEDRQEKTTYSKRPKQCILAMRKRSPYGGGEETRVKIVTEENSQEIMDFAIDNIAGNTEIITDEHSGYTDLSAYFKHTRVNHSIHFMGPSGENTNIVESLFSRLRRCVWGQVHQISPKKLYLYANEIAYREDAREWDNKRTTFDMLGRLLTLEDDDKKPRFRGYWGDYRIRKGGGSSLGVAA